VLVAALAADAIVGTAIGTFGLAELEPLPVSQTAFIAGYALVCSLGPNDLVKSILTKRLWTTTRGRRAVADARAPGRV
jgi:hypothetical protein